MIKPIRIALAASSLALALLSGAAQAVLERVGPASATPSIGGFPAWYQDSTGLTLEFCDPKTQAEVAGGWCLLTPAEVAVAPEVFPGNFFDEHFYHAASASTLSPGGARAVLTLAVEAAFSAGPANPGDQITFSRIRVVLRPVPVTGTYRFIHPYGEERINAVAGDRIFFTEDIGVGSPGDFSGALNSRLGPYLLPATTAGGPELPAVAGPGGLYLANPGRVGPVTGSTLPNFTDSTGASRNHNIFRIEGPVGSGLGVNPANGALVDYIETTNFSLMGRIFTGALPGRIGVDRASYSRDATGQKVDVFATAAATAQARVPGQPRSAAVVPQLAFYAAPCAGTVNPTTGAVSPPFSAPLGVTKTPMLFTAPSIFWGQVQPATLPATVCLEDNAARDAAGTLVPAYLPQVVTDEVSITQAAYDASAGTLTVAASSSDKVVPPTLTVAYGTFRGDLVGGQISVPALIAPPANVRVLSSALGANSYQVSTSFAAAPVPAPTNAAPVAVNDSYSAAVNSTVALSVLANDTDPDGATDLAAAANVTQPIPAGATTSVAGGVVSFRATAAGSYSFTYQAQDVAGALSANTATVTVQVAPPASPEVLTFTRAEYDTRNVRLLVQGKLTPATRQTVTLTFVNAAGAALGAAGSAIADAVGNWVVNATLALPAGATAVRAASPGGTVRVLALRVK